MGETKPPNDLVLTEAQVREVIELATRLPSSKEGISLSDLRQIARELDIDQDALDRALAEVLGRPSARFLMTRLGRLLVNRGRAVVGALIGSVLGWWSGFATDALREVINGMTVMKGSGAFIDVPVAIALILLTLLNSLSRWLDARRRDYVVETVATWGFFLAARALQDGYITQDGTRFVAMAVLTSCLWGWLTIRPRPGSQVRLEHAPGAQGAPSMEEAERTGLQRSAQLTVMASVLRIRTS